MRNALERVNLELAKFGRWMSINGHIMDKNIAGRAAVW